MLKSTCVYFDSDKLYLIRPSVITIVDNHVKINYKEDDIDIGYLDEYNNIYGIIKDKKYYGEDFDSSNSRLFDQDKIPLIKYLFESTYNIECTEEMLKQLEQMKAYYEIDELIDLYDKIRDNDNKIKKLKKFK